MKKAKNAPIFATVALTASIGLTRAEVNTLAASVINTVFYGPCPSKAKLAAMGIEKANWQNWFDISMSHDSSKFIDSMPKEVALAFAMPGWELTKLIEVYEFQERIYNEEDFTLPKTVLQGLCAALSQGPCVNWAASKAAEITARENRTMHQEVDATVKAMTDKLKIYGYVVTPLVKPTATADGFGGTEAQVTAEETAATLKQEKKEGRKAQRKRAEANPPKKSKK